MDRVHLFGKAARLIEIGRRGLTPQKIGVRRVGDGPRNRHVETAVDREKALRSPLAGDERMIALVDVAGQQRGAVGIRARDDERRHAHDVCRQARRGEHANELRNRHEHFSAQVSALFLRGELVLEVNAGGPRLDHQLHQLECIETSAEAGFRVGNDRREPVGVVASVAGIDLIGALQRLIDALDHLRHGVRRIQTLVGIHLAGEIGIGGDLPAAEINRLQAGAHLLHRLIAGQCAKRGYERFVIQELPQPLRSHLRERVLDVDRSTKAENILRRILARDTAPARIRLPVSFQRFGIVNGVQSSAHSGHPRCIFMV